jgi:hypothetical protein
MNQEIKRRWYHKPLVPVFLFLICLSLGVFAGVALHKPVGGLITGAVLGVIIGAVAGKYLEHPKPPPGAQTSGKDILEKYGVYMDGKMKRYSLLFGVNGGAFAIVQLLADQSKTLPGQLTLPKLAVGAILFTAVMVADIWQWGQLMRRAEFVGEMAFTHIGKAILLSIGALIISGWVLAALPS